MECGNIDISDCEECIWLGYDPVENEEVCMLNDERPISEVEVCNINEIMFKAEELVIEEGRKRDEK